MRVQFVSLLLLGLSAACSVKTDRDICPSLLRLRIEDGVSGPVRLSGWSGGNCVFEREDLLRKLEDGSLEFEVPRGNYTLTACNGGGNASGSVFRVPAGRQMDSLYAWSEDIRIDGDTESVSIRLVKQFATVYLRLGGVFADTDCRVMAYGNVCGLDLLSLAPVEGEYLCRAGRLDDWYYCFRLPRQKAVRQENDKGVSVEVYGSGTLLARLDLSAGLDEAGYDWNAELLEDIHVVFDRSSGEFNVGVMPWNETIKEPEIL